MSIIRVGLAETKNFSDGYDLIFGKKEDKQSTENSEKKNDADAVDAKQQEKK